jgi:hypothetical protein
VIENKEFLAMRSVAIEGASWWGLASGERTRQLEGA